MFSDGILYMTIRDCNTIESLFKKIYLSLKIFINLENPFAKENQEEPLDTDETYWKILKILKELEILLILDNSNEIIAHDQSSFRQFLQDILEKLPYLKIIVTCLNSVPVFNDVNNKVFKVTELTNEYSLELMRRSSDSISHLNNELKELIEYDKNFNINKSKNSIYDHPLFNFVGGHPLSIIILSSLRKNMSLLEIFELLQLIKSNYIEDQIDQSTLALTLSVEASLIFAKKENKLSYNALIVFALSPSGYLKKHLVEMYGEPWSECEHLLTSRSLIKFKFVDHNKDSRIEHFSMDSSLSKIIKSRTSQDEIEESYVKIIQKLIDIMNESYKLKNTQQERIADIIVQYEGTIWHILQKLKQDTDEEEHSASNISFESEKSWSGSSNSTKRQCNELSPENYFIKVPNSEGHANALLRAETYRERKNSMIVRLFTGISPEK